MLKQAVVVQIPTEQVDNSITFFIKKANEFSSHITVSREGNTINAKSLLGMLSMRLAAGTELLLEAEGSDAAEALEALAKILQKPA